jgi:CheY-like chemotaxis protein
MLKVLYLPLNVGGNKQLGTIEAFQSLDFVNLEIFDFYGRYESTKNQKLVCQEFINKAAQVQPDLIFMQLQMTGVIDVQTLKEVRNRINKKVIIVNWSGDVRDQANPYIVSSDKGVDITLISSVGQIELYKQAGCKDVRYFQIGYDNKLFYPTFESQFDYDLTVLANCYPKHTFQDAELRNKVILELKQKLGPRFAIFGSGWDSNSSSGCAGTPAQIRKIYNKSFSVLSISNYNDILMYTSDRCFVAGAHGRPMLLWNFPGYENYFSDNQDVIIVKSVTDIIHKLNYLKSKPQLANEIGANGARRMLSEHTYRSRVIELLNMLGFNYS